MVTCSPKSPTSVYLSDMQGDSTAHNVGRAALSYFLDLATEMCEFSRDEFARCPRRG